MSSVLVFVFTFSTFLLSWIWSLGTSFTFIAHGPVTEQFLSVVMVCWMSFNDHAGSTFCTQTCFCVCVCLYNTICFKKFWEYKVPWISQQTLNNTTSDSLTWQAPASPQAPCSSLREADIWRVLVCFPIGDWKDWEILRTKCRAYAISCWVDVSSKKTQALQRCSMKLRGQFGYSTSFNSFTLIKLWYKDV